MNVYHVIYLNNLNENAEAIVVASTAANAWAAAQTNDSTATTLVTVDEIHTNAVVGS